MSGDREAAPGRPLSTLTLLLVLSMAIWGGTWPSGKLVAGAAPFVSTVFFRFLLTTVSLLAVCLARREPLGLDRRSAPWVVAASALMTAYNYLFLGGLHWGLAAKGGVMVTCLNPILTFAISAVAYRRRVGGRETLGLLLGAVAGAVLLGVWTLDARELFRSGNVFFLGAAVAWASLTVVSQSGQKHSGYLAFSLWVYGVCAATNLVILAARGFRLGIAEPLGFWANTAYLGVIGTAFATTVYFFASRKLGAHRAGAFIFLVPAFALLLSWLLLGEVPDWATVAGGAAAVAAVYLVNSAPRERSFGAPEEDARARELNETLDKGPAGPLLSRLGRRLSMPRGIVVQAAEAARGAARFDASAGVALEGRVPLHLESVQRHLADLEPAEIYSYSPTQGKDALRKLWAELQRRKDPSLAGVRCTLPTVVPGLTFGVSAAADLFTDPGDVLLLPEPSWDNYDLIFRVRHGARIRRWRLFDDRGALDLDALRRGLKDERGARALTALFTFPHNPTGYTPTPSEAREIAAILAEAADAGSRILALTDDAYFGLVYDPGAFRESLFALLASAHERILAVKVDGTTKEDLAWGFRVAFVTFGGKGLAEAELGALEEKLCGEIRSLVSSSSTPAQSLLLRALRDSSYEREKAAAFELMAERYRKVRATLDSLDARYPGVARPLPFNSGYFVCLRLPSGGAEAVRKALLEREATGTISFGEDLLRVAYSAVDTDALEPMLEAIYRIISDVGGKRS